MDAKNHLEKNFGKGYAGDRACNNHVTSYNFELDWNNGLTIDCKINDDKCAESVCMCQYGFVKDVLDLIFMGKGIKLNNQHENDFVVEDQCFKQIQISEMLPEIENIST